MLGHAARISDSGRIEKVNGECRRRQFTKTTKTGTTIAFPGVTADIMASPCEISSTAHENFASGPPLMAILNQARKEQDSTRRRISVLRCLTILQFVRWRTLRKEVNARWNPDNATRDGFRIGLPDLFENADRIDLRHRPGDVPMRRAAGGSMDNAFRQAPQQCPPSFSPRTTDARLPVLSSLLKGLDETRFRRSRPTRETGSNQIPHSKPPAR